MAKNMVQAGDVITFTAPAGGVVSGQGIAIGSLFGVAQFDAAEGAQGEMAIEGCHYLRHRAPSLSALRSTGPGRR